MTRHNADVGLQFLRWLYPEGPWVMTAIYQDQDRPTETETFRPGSEETFRAWLSRKNEAQWNVYYHVNRVSRDMRKKAEREDIAFMAFVHVDVDPRTGEDFEKEKDRIRNLFESRLPTSIPKPSALIFSGGGFNALWRLRDPIPIAEGELTQDEVVARYEEAKRYNLQLEIELGGDNCHNIDRILRLPGSVNWPNPKKRRAGRVASVAEIVYTSQDTYPITNFVAAPIVQTKGGSATGSVRVNVSGNIQRLANVNELGEHVPQHLKMVIVQGHDPDEPNKFGSSRSEWLFYVCCGLVRAGVSNETIYSVITDPSFLISASVLDKGSGVERYALRQIQKAREDAIDPKLRVMNEKHFVIGNSGGRCRVYEEQEDHVLGRHHLVAQSFEDFRNRYMTEKVKIGTDPKTGTDKFMELGQWWLKHQNRRQYDTLIFVPGKEIPNAYNMWHGFNCEAKAGDKHLTFLSHLKEVVCGDIEIYYDYLIKWMARAVQHPELQGEVAVVFRGEMGAGKGTVASQFGKIWGRHFLQISDPKHLVGSFNAHLRDAVIVFADEAFYAGDKKHESILKTLITEDLIAIEGKGKDMITSRNFVHLMMASNANWVVPAGPNERRYFVLDVLRTKLKNWEYFERLRKDMDSGGRENFLHFLLTLDISNYKVREVPQTSGLREQKVLSFSVEQEWWYKKLDDGILLRHHIGWTAPVFCDDLVDDYLVYAQKLGLNKRATSTAIGHFIREVIPRERLVKRQQIKRYTNREGVAMQERCYAYHFPPLEECRKHWDEKFGGPYPWTEIEIPNGTEEMGEHF